MKVNVSGNLQVNNSTAIREAVVSGLRVAISPIWLFVDLLDREELKIVLKDYQPTLLPIYALYRRSRFQPTKIRCLIDFLEAEFKLDPYVSSYGQATQAILS